MDIEFSSRSEGELIRRWGKDGGRTIGRRLQQLAAAASLNLVRSIPAARFHPLKGNRTGQFAVDADHPYRLVFEPNQHPIPKKQDGGMDLTRVTKIKVIEVVDYHGD